MTDSFKNRGNAFENKFIQDEEIKFKAEARRNRLVGLWVADKLGINGKAADTYVQEVIKADLEEAGDDDVVRKIMADLSAAHIVLSEQELRTKMSQALEEAVAYFKNGA